MVTEVNVSPNGMSPLVQTKVAGKMPKPTDISSDLFAWVTYILFLHLQRGAQFLNTNNFNICFICIVIRLLKSLKKKGLRENKVNVIYRFVGLIVLTLE